MKLAIALAAASIWLMGSSVVAGPTLYGADKNSPVYLRPANTGVCVPTGDPNFKTYMDSLDEALKKNFQPPKTSNLSAKVIFKVHEDGRITHLQIQKSSGNEAYDKAALTAVEKLEKFKALPAGAPEAVSIQFTFDDKLLQDKPIVGDFES
ncbi:MAG: TonB C-terminal domain-containing protein [Candidatus Obscuribacterales bacterium]|nr:TonB C-terminal domain-containing protein [Candidatus Obscuribacterales bacterium]